MNLISQTTNEEVFLGPPVYFVDSLIRDDNSNAELNRLIAFAKSLKPIEDIRANCNLKIKKEEEEFDIRTTEKEEGNCIVTYIKKYSRKKITDHNNNITYTVWKLIDTKTNYRNIPVRETVRYVYTEIEDKKDKEEGKLSLDGVKLGGDMKINSNFFPATSILVGPYLPIMNERFVDMVTNFCVAKMN